MTYLGRVIVLTGPSGTGKSSLLRHLERTVAAESAPKYTTRPSRLTQDDERDFIFCKPEAFPKENLLSFESYGHHFGIQLDKINASIQRGAFHAIIVGDYEAVRRLASAYNGALISIFVFCSSAILFDRILKDSTSHRADRITSVRHEIETIYDQLSSVDYILDNSGSFEDTCGRLSRIVSRFGG